MPLWGKTNVTSAKPKYLNHVDAGDVYADTRGWIKAVKNADGTTKSEEVLVSIKGLSDAVGGATPTAVYFDKAAYDSDDVVTLTVEWDEELQFTGTVNTSNLTAVGVTLGGSAQAFVYSSGLDAAKEGNKINFTSTLSGTGSLAIGAITVTLAGGLTVADNTGTGTVDLVTTTAENKGAGGLGDYAAITVTAA
tara:strand:- start:2170 stop:2748 length:579 start_codon:yes stop_codon:yes gene_type:complete